jgi:RNA polymerase sigma factor (sigma-70 family)
MNFLLEFHKFAVRSSKVTTSNRGTGGFSADSEEFPLDGLGDIWPDEARGRMRLNDSELYEAIRSGSELRDEAIAQLRELLIRGLSKALTGRYGKPFNAEDVAQETLMKVLNSIDQYSGRSKFVTWAMAIAIRIGISDLRKKYHADQSLDSFRTDDGAKIDITTTVTLTPGLEFSNREFAKLLQQLIDSELTEKQRVVVRAFLSDYSTDGIADGLGMTRNAIYKLLHDARLKLKTGLESHGYDSDDIASFLASGESIK